MSNEHSHRLCASVLCEGWYNLLLDRHIAQCYLFYAETGMALNDHPAEIDVAASVYRQAHEALIATSPAGDFVRGAFGVPGVYVGRN